jgi:hypothetical protein
MFRNLVQLVLLRVGNSFTNSGTSNEHEISVLSLNTNYVSQIGMAPIKKGGNLWVSECRDLHPLCFENLHRYIFDGYTDGRGVPKQNVTFLQDVSHKLFPVLLGKESRVNYSYKGYRFFIAQAKDMPVNLTSTDPVRRKPGRAGAATIISEELLQDGPTTFTSGDLSEFGHLKEPRDGQTSKFMRAYSVVSTDKYTFVNLHGPHYQDYTNLEESTAAGNWIEQIDEHTSAQHKRGNFTLIGGDFNTGFQNSITAVDFNGQRLHRTHNWNTCCMENEKNASTGEYALPFRSDYILTNGVIESSGIETPETFVHATDHMPLRANISFDIAAPSARHAEHGKRRLFKMHPHQLES